MLYPPFDEHIINIQVNLHIIWIQWDHQNLSDLGKNVYTNGNTRILMHIS